MGGFFLIIAMIQRESLFIKKLKCEFMFCVRVEHEKMSNPATMKYRSTLPKHIAEKRRAGEEAERLALRATNAELKKRNRALKSSLKRALEDVIIARTINTGLSMQIKDLGGDRVINEMASLRETVEDLEAKNAAFERQVGRMVDSRMQMMCDLGRAQDDLAKVKEELATTVRDLEKAKRDNERLTVAWWENRELGLEPKDTSKLETEIFNLKASLDVEKGINKQWGQWMKEYHEEEDELSAEVKTLEAEVKRLKQFVADAEEVNKQWDVWATRLQKVLVERGVTTKDEIDEAVKQLSGEVANDLDGDYVRV